MQRLLLGREPGRLPGARVCERVRPRVDGPAREAPRGAVPRACRRRGPDILRLVRRPLLNADLILMLVSLLH